MQNRGYRAPGSGVIEAFYPGYGEISINNWDFLVKLDGDLIIPPEYFQQCLERFRNDLKLGIGGGNVCTVRGGSIEVEQPGDPAFHVRGATKIYRRECWEMISPLVKAPGWDTVDEIKANFFDWKTITFKELKLIQQKNTGSADGKWKDAYKNGMSDYNTGYHPLFVIGKFFKRLIKLEFRVAIGQLLNRQLNI